MSLTNSELKAIVTEVDFIYVSFYTWNINKDGYVRCNNRSHLANQYLHLIIADRIKLSGPTIDHKNRNKLDCSRNNLRVATQSQNLTNRIVSTTSGYKGVSWHSKYQKWRVTITLDGRGVHIGYFMDAVLAAKEYDRYAKQYFGAFAYLNFSE